MCVYCISELDTVENLTLSYVIRGHHMILKLSFTVTVHYTQRQIEAREECSTVTSGKFAESMDKLHMPGQSPKHQRGRWRWRLKLHESEHVG